MYLTLYGKKWWSRNSFVLRWTDMVDPVHPLQLLWKLYFSCKSNRYQIKVPFDFIYIGIFESPKCDVNPQPNTRGIGPLVGRTSGNRRSFMHVLVVIFSTTYHFSFICQCIFIQVILSGREIYPLLMYPSTFLVF